MSIFKYSVRHLVLSVLCNTVSETALTVRLTVSAAKTYEKGEDPCLVENSWCQRTQSEPVCKKWQQCSSKSLNRVALFAACLIPFFPFLLVHHFPLICDAVRTWFSGTGTEFIFISGCAVEKSTFAERWDAALLRTRCRRVYCCT